MKLLATTFVLMFSALSRQVDGEGVTRCYSCGFFTPCQDPLVQEECPQDGTVYVCASVTLNVSSNFAVKGCVPEDPEICKDFVESDTSACYACNQDLCNAKNDIDNGVKKCYFCDGKCDDPLSEVQCPRGNVCLSSLLTLDGESTLEVKGCHPKKIVEDCKSIDDLELSSCYTCEDDLCNEKKKISAKKCYFCNGTCDDPPVQEQCPDVYGTDYVCLSALLTLNGNTTLEVKGCYPGTVIQDCKTIDDLELSRCSACAEDLCNA